MDHIEKRCEDRPKDCLALRCLHRSEQVEAMAPSDVPVARDVDPGDQASGVSPLALSMPSCRRCAWPGRGPHAPGIPDVRLRPPARLPRLPDLVPPLRGVDGIGGRGPVRAVGHAQGRCAIVASFKRAEYAADFIMLARRVLAHRPVEMAVFEAYHVDDLEWNVAVPRVNRHPPPAAPARIAGRSSTPCIAPRV